MIQVYLNFNGDGREAMAYYEKVFGGKITYIQKFEDMPEEDQKYMPELKDRLVHGNLETFAGVIMLSDVPAGTEVTPTDAVNIAVSHSDLDKLKEAFDNLAEEGTIEMPLGETFFSPFFGMVKDKYGFSWMLMSDEGM